MSRQLLIAGAGMGGLATAIASARAGWQARVYEQAAQLSEVGAGIQLGPNATRILREWGLSAALDAVAFAPEHLKAYSALDGSELGTLRLGAFFVQRYGAPYLAIHRADLQSALMDAASRAGAQVEVGSRVTDVTVSPESIGLALADGRKVEADALVGADGLWSAVRALVWCDGGPGGTGHVAYRAMASQQGLPAGLRSRSVRVWLGPRLHVVAYPVRAGELLNVVVIVQGGTAGAARDWDQHGSSSELLAAMGPLCRPLQDLVSAMPEWHLWFLHDRAPLRGAGQMAHGRVALLGDAAHPMLPYLAQGAAMAIEDASALGHALSKTPHAEADSGVAAALQRYALNRWERCAKVQTRAKRNGHIFHATGVVKWGRNAAMRMLGERLLDQPWLYR